MRGVATTQDLNEAAADVETTGRREMYLLERVRPDDYRSDLALPQPPLVAELRTLEREAKTGLHTGVGDVHEPLHAGSLGLFDQCRGAQPVNRSNRGLPVAGKSAPDGRRRRYHRGGVHACRGASTPIAQITADDIHTKFGNAGRGGFGSHESPRRQTGLDEPADD